MIHDESHADGDDECKGEADDDIEGLACTALNLQSTQDGGRILVKGILQWHPSGLCRSGCSQDGLQVRKLNESA